jgi:L-gulonolactone oxidase
MRVSAADDIWLSPAYGRRVLWIGIMQYKPVRRTWARRWRYSHEHAQYNFPVPYKRLFRRFEKITLAHDGRPHWAKAHTASKADLEGMYERMPDFLAVRKRVDPDGVFLNSYLRRQCVCCSSNGLELTARSLFGDVGEAADMNRWKWSSPAWRATSV